MDISIGNYTRRFLMKLGEDAIAELRAEVQTVTKTVETLVIKMDTLTTSLASVSDLLIDYLSGRTPPNSVPTETHQLIVKGLIRGFTVLLAVSVGVVKFVPILIDYAGH